MLLFLDGAAGTTGLRIHERLSGRGDLTLLTLSEAERKDPAKRREALNSCDIAVLCLPDEAAKEAVKAQIDKENNNSISFGNARGIRNIFERVLVAQANRLAAMENVTREDLMKITAEDIDLSDGEADRDDEKKEQE